MKWESRQLRELIKIEHGFAFSSKDFGRDGKYVVLTPGNFYENGGFRARLDKVRFLTTEPPEGYVLKQGALVVAMTEQAPGLLGSCAVIPEGGRFLHNQRLGSIVIIDPSEIAPEFLYYVLNSAKVRKQIHRSAGGTKVRHTSPSKIGCAWVPCPPVKIQRKIANALAVFDAIIGLLGSSIAAKGDLKRGLTGDLFAGHKSGREWMFFGELCQEIAERNEGRLGPESVMGIIKGIGFQPMRDRVRGKSDVARYLVVPPGAFAYNPMRLNIGSIAFNDLGCDVLVSPDYVVFRPRPLASAAYINQLRHSPLWQQYMKRAGAGSVRVRIYFDDLARLRFPVPAVQEREQIATVLGLMDLEIGLLEAQREQYQLYKQGLMDRLLSGEPS